MKGLSSSLWLEFSSTFLLNILAWMEWLTAPQMAIFPSGVHFSTRSFCWEPGFVKIRILNTSLVKAKTERALLEPLLLFHEKAGMSVAAGQ